MNEKTPSREAWESPGGIRRNEVKQAELQGLDEEEAVLLLKARAAFVREGIPARDTLEASDAPAQKRAAVAERLAPGSGAEWLR